MKRLLISVFLSWAILGCSPNQETDPSSPPQLGEVYEHTETGHRVTISYVGKCAENVTTISRVNETCVWVTIGSSTGRPNMWPIERFHEAHKLVPETRD